jgi:hypothetical protein
LSRVARGFNLMKFSSAIFAAIFFCGTSLAEETGKTTKGIIDIKDLKRPEGAVQLVGDAEHHFVPAGKEASLWVFKDGVLTASPKWDSVVTKTPYRDFQMHVEFNVNDVPDAKNPEDNGNSGIYIQQRYEVQILNSAGISAEEYKASHAGSIYKIKKPDQLVSKKAGEWQTYDIVFRAARFEGETKTEDSRITVYHNGALIHDDFAIPRKTGAGQKEGPEPGLIKLQGHHNPVKYRNIWIKELTLD